MSTLGLEGPPQDVSTGGAQVLGLELGPQEGLGKARLQKVQGARWGHTGCSHETWNPHSHAALRRNRPHDAQPRTVWERNDCVES